MIHLTFLSARFSTIPAPEAINDNLGADVAAWLRAGLLRAGFEVSEVIPEDYGFGFWLPQDGWQAWLSVTAYEPIGVEGRSEPTWLIGIDDHAGCLSLMRIRPRSAPAVLDRIADAVIALLRADSSVSEIMRWAQGVRRGTGTAV